MIDEDTLTVAYRDWRGEPRGKLHKGSSRLTMATVLTVWPV